MASYYSCLNKLFSLYRQTKKQERYLKEYLPVLLKDVAPELAMSFSPAQFKRTLKYWQLGLNVICDNLYQLQGKELSDTEYKRIILLSVFGPMFDDLFDDGGMDLEEIRSLVVAPENSDRPVAKVYLALLQITPQRDQVIQHLQQVCHWQQASLKQLQADISEEELHSITYHKSYYSVLLYCAVLDSYPSEDLLQLLYPVSGLLQLTNDAFDVWKDLQQQVYTLPNRYRNFEKLKGLFLSETALINKGLMPYKKDCAITFHALPAMGWIALEHLQKVTSGVTSLSELSRKELVCDMDSVQQQVKWLRLVKRFTDLSTTSPAPLYPALSVHGQQ
jgi:hypothetical protein